MKIWVDADACPGAIRDIILRAANNRQVATVFVANKPLSLPASPYCVFVQVALGSDVVDQYILDQLQPGDMVITQDIPLAAELVNRNVPAISPHGILFTAANIGDRLAARDLMHDLRGSGLISGGPKPFSDKDKRQFANTFDQVLTRLLKAQGAMGNSGRLPHSAQEPS